ncbi:MAG: 3-phosphoshikimate 1-carboxyvinyltransferase [Acidobacteriota bacterium]|nr:3-phosphoshikimate 1-carboxyvinyltransferase [Blastocatellia bacterium]MDW8411152.1 3-phosphoshikimate 1-carboxyvinyltransferase [Acidobacteriota bacterium]
MRAVRLARRGLKGRVSVPGDKSISHRAALLAALAQGTTQIANFSSSADCRSTLNCLSALGTDIIIKDNLVVIEGKGLDGFRPAAGMLDAGNSGSTMRMLAGILAGQSFESVITGDESLRLRPMNRIAIPLRQMGAEVITSEGGYAPLRIRGGRLCPIEYTLPVASAQVKSCVLLAGLYADGVTAVYEPVPTRNHTEIMLKEFGAAVEVSGAGVAVRGYPRMRACDYVVACDISSAAFLIAAAVLLPDSDLTLVNVGVNPTRRSFIDLLLSWGAQIELLNLRFVHGEPVADVRVQSSVLRADSLSRSISGKVIANLIDEIPILAVIATKVEGGVCVRDAAELRVKESDRLRYIVDNLRAMGVEVTEYADGFEIERPQKLRSAKVVTAQDHRIAMAFTIAGLLADGETLIDFPECVAVSFPSFYDTLDEVLSYAD